MSRPDRWWRPSTTRRPAQRARQRRVYTVGDVADGFEVGYRAGQGDEEKRWRDYADRMLRLADASQAASDGDPGPMDELRREMGWRDDDLAVADAAGVTPLAEDERDSIPFIGDEVERWLREQDGDG